MKMQFEDNLDYQADAVRAVIDLFRGQPKIHSQFSIISGKSSASLGEIQNDLGIGNRLLLSDDEILKNLQSVQKQNGLPEDSNFKEGKFTIEMETGTGKTYVYLRTIFELHKNFGFSKFIIIVPSIAIKEGVYKTLQITRSHFEGLYPESAKECSCFLYDSKKLSQVRNFAAATTVQIMLTTIGALNRQEINSIYKENEKTGGEKPIDLLRATSPVIIVDEPQSVEGGTNGRGREAISKIDALCMLHYSATHKDSYNKIYQLNAVDAYDRKLVKKIEIASLGTKNDLNKPYIYLEDTWNKNSSLICRIEAVVIDKKGQAKKEKCDLQKRENLEKETNNPMYNGYTLSEITKKYIKFSYPGGEKILNIGEEFNGVNNDIRQRAMIKRTIKEHLDKELKFASQKLPIKVLSLFFIDRVENYRIYKEGDKGKYAEIFEEEYSAMAQLPEYQVLFDNAAIDAAQVHEGYFSMDKKGFWQNTDENNENNREKAGRAYNLIMKDKEKLLSFDCPLKFIFSHSALKEGWDNPNVFQICALREMKSEQQKRQTIGRGMRLCVSQNGERVRDSNINTLTVVAAEHYEEYAAKLQREIENESGIRFGFVEKNSFSNINIATEGGEKELLGIENSKKIWDFLRQEGYINISGIPTDTLRQLLANDEILLPMEFDNLKVEIIKVLQKINRGFEIKNADERVKIKLCKERLDDKFNALWEQIKYKTTYCVKFDSNKLIKNCIAELNRMPPTSKIEIGFRKAGLSIGAGGITIEEEIVGEFSTIEEGDIPLPDLLGELQNQTKLTRRSLINIICGTNTGINNFLRNPREFIEITTKIINDKKQELIVDGICYRRIGDKFYYSQELFANEELTAYFKNTLKVKKSVYDHVIYESESVEKKFANDLENNESIKVYAKLPRWFVIQTPLGTYNPDWAVLADVSGQEKLYLVAETKSSDLKINLRPAEIRKVKCGEKHFEAVGQGKQNPAHFVLTRSVENALTQGKKKLLSQKNNSKN